MTVKEVLIAARAKIADPANWTQGVAARNSDGLVTLARSRDAACWCSVGAIVSIAGNGDLGYSAKDALCKAISGGTFKDGGAADFNDTHTHAEVLAKFDEAITAQGGE